MCIAIANVKGMPITKKQFMNSWENNSHGGGMLYKEDGELRCHYELTDKNKLYEVYSHKIRKSNVLLHFRITSKGIKNVDNCHPFMVNDKLGFIHNGTIHQGLKDYGKEKSDTWAFNEQILKNMPTDFYNYPVLMDLIASKTGNSKIAFMDIDEHITIIGEAKGEAHFDPNTGNWFSNKSYQQVNDFVWKGDQKVKKNQTLGVIPKPKYPSYSKYPPQMFYSWSEDLANNNIANGFAKTMKEIAWQSRKWMKYTDGNVLLEQFIPHQRRWLTVRRAMEVVFEDWLYDKDPRELINCLRYYHAQNNKALADKAKAEGKRVRDEIQNRSL